MFDLDDAVKSWRRTFQRFPYYTPGIVAELESHLLDAFYEKKRSGCGREKAFHQAVDQVGQESTLRSEFMQEWESRSVFSRYLQAMISELNCCTSPGSRLFYGATRTLSFLVGIAALIVIPIALTNLLQATFRWPWDGGSWFQLQGLMFLASLPLISHFNLMPFDVTRYGRHNTIRRVTCVWLGLVTAYCFVLLVQYQPPNAVDALIWLTLLLAGPTLWSFQRVLKRDVAFTEYPD